MKNYLSKLNWYGFVILLLLSILAAMTRNQDESILHSLTIGLILGIPISLFFLFIGKKK
jgi:uncharacterized membrane protein YkvI